MTLEQFNAAHIALQTKLTTLQTEIATHEAEAKRLTGVASEEQLIDLRKRRYQLQGEYNNTHNQKLNLVKKFSKYQHED